MTPKQKFQDIDTSKLPQKALSQLDIVKDYFDEKSAADLKKAYPDTFEEDYAEAEQSMNTLYRLISEKYPESIKSKAAKAPEPKTPAAMAKKAAQQTIKQPRGKKTTATAGPTKKAANIALAKKIYKKGEETWHEAIRRASAMIEAEKKSAVKKANKQYQKLKAYLAKHPIKKGATDVERDAPRKALPIGKRVAKKSGRTYYEYRENRTDRRRSGFPYLALGGKLHGAGQFAKGGKTGIGHYVVDGNVFIDYMEAVDYCDKHKMPYSKIVKKKSYADGGMMDDYAKSFGMVKVKFANPEYNYETSVAGHITEAEARKYFVGQMFNVGVYPNEKMEKVMDIEFYPKGTYAKGGKTKKGDNLPNTADEYFAAMDTFSKRLGQAEANFSKDNGASYNKILAERDEFFEKTKAKWYAELNKAEGNFSKDGGKSYNAAMKKLDDARLRYAKGGVTDLFEDYENIPPNVQVILDKYQDAFEDGDYKGLHEAHEAVEKEGYTFEYYLDGQAYGLRPIGVPLNEVKGYEEFSKGGKMAEGGEYGKDFGYHVINREVTLKDGRKTYLTKGRYYWSNELGDNRPSGIYYVTKDGEFISSDMINYPILAKGGKTKSKTYKVDIISSGIQKVIMSKTFTDKDKAINYAYTADRINDDMWYFNLYGLDKDGKKIIRVYDFGEYDDEKETYLNGDYVKKLPKYKNCVAWKVDMVHADYPTNKVIYSQTYNTFRQAEKLIHGIEHDLLYANINNVYYEDRKNIEKLAKGGKMGFKALSAKVAARYKGKSVPAKYRKEYGSTYDKAEAKEVGNKVAAKVYRQQLAKK